MRKFTNTAEKILEAGDKKCIKAGYGYKYRATPFHKLGLAYGVLLKAGGGFTTYQFGDGSSYRVTKAFTEVNY